MRLFLYFFIFSLSFQTARTSELIEVDSHEKTDFQESAFIKLMNNLNDGKIPYPFSDLLDSFGTGTREEGNVLFVPQGRSLVKESADYRNPRIIVNPISNGASPDKFEFDDNGKKIRKNSEEMIWDENRKKINDLGISGSDLFIGFAPNHKALEVISYNPKKPGYDFFIVEDYEPGKTPKVVNNPGLCLSCHQNEAPIFSRFPWSEMLGGATKGLVDQGQINADVDKNQAMKLIREANLDRKEIEGINLDPENKRFTFSQVNRFDALVRISNIPITDNKYCEVLCPKSDDVSCQQNLILISKSKDQDFSQSSFFKNVENDFNKLDIKSSVIPDRDPITNVGFENVIDKDFLAKMSKESSSFVRQDLESTYGKLEKYDLTYDEISSDFSKILPLNDNTAINPAATRPLNSNLMKAKRKLDNTPVLNEKIKILVDLCLPHSIEKIPAKDINESLLRRPSVVKALKYWPDTTRIGKAINDEVIKEKNPSLNEMISCTEKIRPIIPVFKYYDIEKVVTKINDDKIKKPQALFQQYCTQCHGGEKAFIPLPLDSMEGMASYVPKFGDKAVKERLEKKLMPPAYSKQPSEEERAEMIKVIKELSK